MTTEEHSDRSIDTNQTSSETDLSTNQIEELLTETINKLEAIVAKLKATSMTNNLSSASVQTIVNTTETLFNAVENKISSLATEKKLEPTNQTVSSITKSKLSSSKPQFPNLWQKLLNQLRSNLILTGSLVGIIVLIIAASIFVLPQKFSQTEIAVNPVISPQKLPIIIETKNTTSTKTTTSEPLDLPQTEIEPEKTDIFSEMAELSAREMLPKSVLIAEISPAIISEIEPEKTDISSEKTSSEITTSLDQEIVSETPKPKIPESKPETISQPVPLKLTPEQNLIAAIKSRLEEIINQYPDDLFLLIEANFLQSNLLVKISDRWYELKPTEQTKLANEILHKSQKLDFKKIEIKDYTGDLVARNPVVGKEIVILKRAK